jgi:hypothetical protein
VFEREEVDLNHRHGGSAVQTRRARRGASQVKGTNALVLNQAKAATNAQGREEAV